MEISLLIWSNQISLFLWISSYPNVTIRVGDNYFWKLITIRGPYGTQKGALGAPGKKKRFSKGGIQKNRDHLMSLDILVSKYQKKIRSLPNFSESKIFLSPWCFLQSKEISLQIWSNKIFLFLWISSYPNVTIRVGDNYFWKLITIRGPYGTPKGALRGPRPKKKVLKRGVQKNRDLLISLDILLSKYKKKSFSSKFFRVQNFLKVCDFYYIP